MIYFSREANPKQNIVYFVLRKRINAYQVLNCHEGNAKARYTVHQTCKSYTLFLCISLILSKTCQAYIDVSPSFPAIFKAPQTVVLLLPLKGHYRSVSQSVKLGFLEACQHAKVSTKVHVLDTQDFQSIYHAYLHCVYLNADLIVGPLLKEEVTALAKIPEMKIPVLTLNYLNPSHIYPANFYQFGFSFHDEIKQLTQYSKSQQHLALVVVPDTRWGKEITQTFTKIWHMAEGEVVDVLYYPSAFQALNKKIRHFLKFKPPQQRRQDFDMLFLASSPESARQIKPLFDFYFAKDIPVYATSSIYEATVPYHLNYDLDGTILCGTYWSCQPITQQSTLYRQLTTKYLKHFQRYSKYYALGVDAFLLTQSLLKLEQDAHYIVKGVTGKLQLNVARQIVRESPLFSFKRGVLKMLPEKEYNLTINNAVLL